VKPGPEDIIQALFDAVEKGLRVVVTNPFGTVDLGASSLAALEEVQVNVTGEGGIATEQTLAALLTMLTPGTPEQYAGTVDVTAQTVTFSGPTKYVVVSNPKKRATLEVSFDGGSSFVTVTEASVLAMPCRVTEVQIRSTGERRDYEIIAMV
jgi:sarcosine oxidase gamma subunit